MKCKFFVLLVSIAISIGITSNVFSAEYPNNYLAIKGGVYYPSENHDIRNFNSGSTTHLDTKTGFNGEVALGHYFYPYLALEFSGGYFESKGSPPAEPGESRFKVVPVLLTGKLLIPAGVIEPYGEFGIGGYIAELDVSGNGGNFSGSTRITYGLHAGAGININLGSTVFIGLEGRYLWVEPSFGGQDIRLDGFTATGALGFRF